LHAGWESHRFSLNVAHRRMGKSVAVINKIIKSAITNIRQRPRYAYIGPFLKQTKKIAWDYLKHYAAPFPGVRKNESELWVELPNGARIELYGADNPDAIRGIYLDGAVLDEAAQIKPELWGEVVRPMLADRDGWAVMIGTPKGQLGLFWDMYQKSLASDEWFVSEHRADQTHVIDPSELERIQSDLTDSQYRQEFLCDWTVSNEDVLIPWDIVYPAAGRYIPPDAYSSAPLILSIDVARFGDDSTVFCWRRGLAMLSYQQFRKLSTMHTADRAAYEIGRRAPAVTFVDVVGVGAGVYDRLKQLGFQVLPVSAGDKARQSAKYQNKRVEMWDGMKRWLEEGGAIPDDPLLRKELMSPTYSFDSNGRMVLEKKEDMKKRGLMSPNIADALAGSFAAPVPVLQPDWALGTGRQDVGDGVDFDPLDWRAA
jgi:hypothetical protein